jgi:3,4-dihydroxy 2-butanone 4-phosphate synthase/GTP cyclohydrolase II
LEDLGVRSVRLLTNNPDKIEKLEALGVAVTQRMALRPTVQAENEEYLRTKVERMRHLLELDAAELIAPVPAFMPERLVKNGRSFITLSYAQSLDGSITAKRGQPTAISGDAAMAVTHQLRAAHEAILVGIGAVLADDPRLTVRLADGRPSHGAQPRPIVLDSQLRLPLTAKLLQHRHRPWIFTTMATSDERAAALEARGAVIIRVASDENGRVLLTAVIDHLYKNGIQNVMVEGGAQIITSFFLERLVDHMVVTIAPTLLAGLNAIGAVNGTELPHLENTNYHICGTDMVLSGEAIWSEI